MTEQSSPNTYEAAEWLAYAVCAKPDAVSMFPDASNAPHIAAAKEHCDICPVRIECLSSALARGEQHGIWGGLTTEERKLLRRRQTRNGRTS